jgi:pimeloyl-ACP methyl ester carboxylesterase
MEHGGERHSQRAALVGRLTQKGARGRRAALVSVMAALVAGCSATGSAGPTRLAGPNPAVQLTPAAPTTTTQPPLPVTPVQWQPCGALQCGSVTAPLDYVHPNGATIQIAMARHPAVVPSERIGSVVINPGGPGGSGIDDLPNELSVLPAGVVDRFDVISFDPRGVQRSSPVSCTSGSNSSSGGPDPNPVPATPAQQQQLLQSDQQYASACQQASGTVLPFVGSVDAARDLDRIRQAVGDAGLTFIGHSYGTLLGATYAELFPTHVRAMVLDGAIDPALTTQQYLVDQSNSLEAELKSFFAWCASSGCAWRPAGDPTAALLALIRRAADQPLPAGGGTAAGPGTIYSTLLAGLLSQSSWPTLAGALASAAAGNGSAASSISGRYDRGGSSNGADAERAIDCLDHPTDRNPSTYAALAGAVGQTAPVFGPLLAWGLLTCATWPALPTRTPAPALDVGAPPILVVGTTGDPVTPYKWAQALAGELSGGVLLTWQGQSHVAYFYSSCVRSAYESYLVAGVSPTPGTTCTD